MSLRRLVATVPDLIDYDAQLHDWLAQEDIKVSLHHYEQAMAVVDVYECSETCEGLEWCRGAYYLNEICELFNELDKNRFMQDEEGGDGTLIQCRTDNEDVIEEIYGMGHSHSPQPYHYNALGTPTNITNTNVANTSVVNNQSTNIINNITVIVPAGYNGVPRIISNHQTVNQQGRSSGSQNVHVDTNTSHGQGPPPSRYGGGYGYGGAYNGSPDFMYRGGRYSPPGRHYPHTPVDPRYYDDSYAHGYNRYPTPYNGWYPHDNGGYQGYDNGGYY